MNPRRAGRTLSVVLTYRCNAQCAQCGTFSSPHDRSNVALSDVKATIDECGALGFANVVFTGGEATLRWDDLLEGIRYAVASGFPTRLVTNGQWAHSDEAAASCVEQLVAARLSEINVSTGDEHVRFVGMPYIARAVVHALRAGLRTVIMVELRAAASVIKATVEEAIAALDPMALDSPLLSFIESPWMPMRGTRAGEHSPEMAANRANVSARRGCDSVLQTYVLQGTGRFASCCGLGMRKIPELQHGYVHRGGTLAQTVEEAEGDLIKHALSVIGPENLLARLAEKDPGLDWENRYAHRCHACLRIYEDEHVKAQLRTHAFELLPDIVISRYLDEFAIPAAFAGTETPTPGRQHETGS